MCFASNAIETIRDWINLSPPELETGGLLFGAKDAVTIATPIVNSSLHPSVQFAIEPEELARQVGHAEELGLSLLGTFHTHPGRLAVMSREDAASARQTGLLLIIGTSPDGWDWRLWDPLAGGEVELKIAPSSLRTV